VLALKMLLDGHVGGAFNLGTGNGFSVREILAAIAAETGREVRHLIKPRRAGDPTYLVADPSAAHKTLNFHPSIRIWRPSSVPPGRGTGRLIR
jgi:UDP-glucose 4-epimerase